MSNILLNKICKVWNRNFNVEIEKDEDDYYIVSCPRIQGCHTAGKSINEAMSMIEEVITGCLESIAIEDLKIKIPHTDKEKEMFFAKYSEFVWTNRRK